MGRLILQLVRPYRWRAAIVLAAMLVQAAVGLLAPWPLKIIIDSLVGNHPVPLWTSWFAPMLARGGKMQVAALAAIITVEIAVAGALAGYVGNYFVENVGQRVANDLRIRTYHHLQRLSLSYYHSHPVGTILSTITTDVTTIQTFASQSTISIFIDMLMIVGMVVVMFALHWDFALIAIALFPFLILFVARIRAAIEKTITEVRRIQADMVAIAQEDLESIEAVEAFEREDLEERQLARISWLSVEAAMKARRVRALLGPVVSVPIALSTAFVLWRGSALIVNGAMTLGSLTVFTAYLARFFLPVQDLAGQMDSIAQASVAAQRIQALLEAESIIPERPDAVDPPPFRGEIAFEHVAFSYDADTPVLQNVSFGIKAGELVGIVGATGSGKSTIVSLIPRFYDANAGTITIDGADIRDFKLHGLRSQIGFVLQETVLFRGTVRDNIAFGRPDATEQEIIQAAKLANADEFITRMPHGYDSVVGERGLTLSGGQRQRIGIARALIRNDPILILDEPTAALDAESEQLVIEAMERLMKGRTVICIAHRLSTIRDANKIVVIKDGVVAEEGTHQELLDLNGAYAQLHRIQYKEQRA
ncbi:MAG: ABC transporter ATP-binding protein [Mycobacterium sp.]|uniref:ABC transporter ATP-binding protein n=1 Tax=Mycobacterium sp. TaxID=1785 RepID=UPI002844AD49|nr:ABC transporter ATP-binding protein [Mycobacterium sp.]MDR3660333.1 ABC transporter ATP-binding protein [Mycobacterium sp.]